MSYPIYPDYQYDPEDKRFYTTLPYFQQKGLFIEVIGLNKSSLPLESLEDFQRSCRELLKNRPNSLSIDGFLIEYGQTDINKLINKYKFRV